MHPTFQYTVKILNHQVFPIYLMLLTAAAGVEDNWPVVCKAKGGRCRVVHTDPELLRIELAVVARRIPFPVHFFHRSFPGNTSQDGLAAGAGSVSQQYRPVVCQL